MYSRGPRFFQKIRSQELPRSEDGLLVRSTDVKYARKEPSRREGMLDEQLTTTRCSSGLVQENKVVSPHLREACSLVDRCISDTRTLSHLLHPPLLDEAGFASAAKWYVEGFGQRSGIATQLNLPEQIHRLPTRMETALFRILQEALTNVHRHSGSRAVQVRVSLDKMRVVLTVRDFGTGVSGEILDRFWKTGNVGVGLAGIRERLKELGGFLEIESNRDGTLLKATIPISAADGLDSADENPIAPPGGHPPAVPAA